jgi:hypothetical protein
LAGWSKEILSARRESQRWHQHEKEKIRSLSVLISGLEFSPTA